MDRPTHSPDWHRIGPLRPRLRPGVRVHRRYFRARRSYVLHDPAANQFFRLDAVSYHLLALMDGKLSVDEAWWQTTDRYGDRAPTQNEIVGLLGQMYQVNLIALDDAVDGEQLFARKRKRLESKVRQQATSFLFLQIPLLDPGPIIDWLMPIVKWLFQWWLLVAWALLLIGAGTAVAVHWESFRLEASQLLRPGNLPMLAAAFLGVKALHEFGHGIACRYFGGEVHEMGVKLLVFAPVPYCDATSSWGLKTRGQRAMVGAAGIIVELWIAGVAAILWVNTQPGPLHELCYNIIFLSGVASLLFNANPLLRYDGYYVLSDLLDIPNLYQRANSQVQYLVQKHVMGMKVNPVSHSRNEQAWLVGYFAAAWVYRVFVFAAILYFVSRQLFGLGILIAVLACVGWVVKPMLNLVRWLASDPGLNHCRARAVAITTAVALAAVVGLGLIPVDEHARSQAVIEVPQRAEVVAGAEGFIEKVLVADGQYVRQGQVLVESVNPVLRAQRETLSAQRVDLQVMLSKATAVGTTPKDVNIIQARIGSLSGQIDELDNRIAQLQVRSPIEGTVIAPRLAELTGAFVKRGRPLAMVHAPGPLRATAVVDQTQNARLFDGSLRLVELRTAGRPDRVISGRITGRRQAGQLDLPHTALGFAGGGEVKIDTADRTGRVATHTVFEVLISLDQQEKLHPGQRATVRFTMEPRPLIAQWYTRVRQTLG